jgi:hypothetical protein
MNIHWNSCQPNTICFASHRTPWYIVSCRHCSTSLSFAQSSSRCGLLSLCTRSSRCSPKARSLWYRGIPQWKRTHLQSLRHLIHLKLISPLNKCIQLFNHYWNLINRNCLLKPLPLGFHFHSNKHFLGKGSRQFFL